MRATSSSSTTRTSKRFGFGGTFHGHDGMVRFLERWGEAWEGWELMPAAVLDMGDDRFIALAHVRLPGTTSGVELESEFAQLVTVRNGLITRDQEFRSWDKGRTTSTSRSLIVHGTAGS